MWNKHFKFQRLVKLWMEVWIYSVVSGAFYFGLGYEQVTWLQVIKILMPITFNEYWYMSTYVILYFLMPYINKLITHFDKKQHKFFILIFLIFFSIMPTTTTMRWTVGTGNLLIFIGLYVAGAYISKYNIMEITNKRVNCIGVLVGVVAIWISEIVLKIVGLSPFYFSEEMFKTPVTITAVFLFLLFINLQVNLPQIILTSARSVYGVYLFHIGRLNKIIFLMLFNNSLVYQNSIILIIHIIMVVLIIFIIGVLIHQIMSKILEVTVFKFTKNIINRVEKCINQFY